VIVFEDELDAGNFNAICRLLEKELVVHGQVVVDKFQSSCFIIVDRHFNCYLEIAAVVGVLFLEYRNGASVLLSA